VLEYNLELNFEFRKANFFLVGSFSELRLHVKFVLPALLGRCVNLNTRPTEHV